MQKRGFLGMVAGLGLALVWSACSPVVRTIEGTGGHGGGGTGGAGGTGTGGTMMGCKPGDMVDCYSGPPGTEGVGQCAAGKAMCGADGTPGTCVGEVLPAAKVQCKLHQDQDCDGVTDRCPLELIWANAYTADQGNNNAAHGVVVDPKDDSVIVAGWLDGQVDFGMGPAGPTTQGDQDVFVTKLDKQGKLVWSKRYGDTQQQEANAVGLDAAGNVYVAGSYQGTMDFDGNLVLPTSAGASDAFLVKLDANGGPVWQRTGGDVGDQVVTALAVAPAGGVVVAGTFQNTFAWTGNGASLPGNGNDTYTFVQRFDDSANSVFSVATSGMVGGPINTHNVTSVAVDKDDAVLVAGSFQGSISFSNGQTYSSVGNTDVFVAKLDGTGKVLWAKAFGSMGQDQATSVTSDSKGNVLLTGSFQTSLTLDSSVVTTAGNTGLFLARLSSIGEVISARGFGAGSGLDRMYVAVDGADNMLLGGFFDGTIGFGGDLFDSKLMGQPGIATFVAKLDPGGAHIASSAFGMGGYMAFLGIAAGPKSIAVAGATLFPVDLGAGMIGQSQIADPVVATFAP